MTDKELSDINSDADKIMEKLQKAEEEALKNMLKHFDRIHDKLFTFNNILIAGYFTLSKIQEEISLWTILIPIGNMIILMFIEYRMMIKSRFESQITQKSKIERDRWGASINITNRYSLASIVSTLIVTVVFVKLFLTS